MKKTLFSLFLLNHCAVFSQSNEGEHIFSDTSLYFIKQADSSHPVYLSPADLAEAERIFVKAVEEFSQYQQKSSDSLNPKRKKRKGQYFEIDVNRYFFRLMPALNKENQKVVWINGDCKDWFNTGTIKNPIYEKNWKVKFIEGHMVEDGGTCFIYLIINLTLETHDRLVMNGTG